MALNDWETLPRVPVNKSESPVTKLLLKVVGEHGRVKIRYIVRGKSSERWIKPKAIFKVQSSRWRGEYVDAHCEMRDSTRIFEIENIEILEPRVSAVATPLRQKAVPAGRIACVVEYADLQGDNGEVEGIQVECPRCGHQTESFGTSAASVRRCLALLREECPYDESNFYIEA